MKKLLLWALLLGWVGLAFYGGMERTKGDVLVSIIMALFVPCIIAALLYGRAPRFFSGR